MGFHEMTHAFIAVNYTEISETAPDYTMNIYKCPWHEQFKKMGLKEAGLTYCRDLDASICRGFNPEITYLVPQTLHDHDHCIQIVKNAGITPESKLQKNTDRKWRIFLRDTAGRILIWHKNRKKSGGERNLPFSFIKLIDTID